MQRAPNDFICNMRSVEIAGVDVVHACFYRLAQHGDGGVGISRWPKHAGTGELHGAVPHPVHAH